MARATVRSQHNPWGWAGLGGGIGLITAALLFAPAHWLADAAGRFTDERLLLSDARGTLWNGSAELRLTGGAGSSDLAILPTRLTWQLRPRWDGVAVQLTSACCAELPVTLRVRLHWDRVQVDIADGHTQWPAALLAGLGTPWNTLQFDGDLRLETQSLSVEWVQGRLALAGQAQLTAQRMSSRLSTLRPMGSYRITVLGGAAPTLQLETLEGSLQLSGSGQWVGSRLRFNGTASAAPEREEALSNLLNIIGRRNGPHSIITVG